MSEVVGGVFTSHVPGIGAAIAKGLQNDPYWKPFFDGFAPVHTFLERTKPDVAVDSRRRLGDGDRRVRMCRGREKEAAGRRREREQPPVDELLERLGDRQRLAALR